MLNIVTLATSSYKVLLLNIIDRFLLIFPQIKKQLIIIADDHIECDREDVKQFIIDDSNICYKFILLHKLNYIDAAFKKFAIQDTDLFMYIDATIFLVEKTKEQWAQTFARLYSKAMWFSFHPMYWQYNADIPHEKFFTIFDDNIPNMASYINKKIYWTIGACWGGTVMEFRKFYKSYNIYYWKDVHNNYIPTYPDEQYINKILNDGYYNKESFNAYIGVHTAFLKIDPTNPPTTYQDVYPDLIGYQHYIDFKNTKKVDPENPDAIPVFKFGGKQVDENLSVLDDKGHMR